MPQFQRENKTITLSIPHWLQFAARIVDYGSKFKERLDGKQSFLSTIGNLLKKLPKEKINMWFREKIAQVKKHPKVSLTVFLILLLIFGVFIFKKTASGKLGQSVNISGSATDFAPQQQVTVNRTFDLPIRSADGKDTGDKLKVTLSTFDRSKRILIQGKPATSRDGKVFVIINMEVDNSSKNQLTIRPVDFIRFVDENSRNFAPDVHNNDVTVEAISIKKTRVGFVADENRKHFRFLVGEINGEKQEVNVDF